MALCPFLNSEKVNMQKEDKYLAASLFFAVVAGGAIFSTLHHSQAATPTSIAETLPVGTTRAEVIGKTHQADPQAHQPYVLVEFGDYQCPPCRGEFGGLKTLVAQRQSQVGFVFRHYPLIQIHPAAFTAALYVEAAREQGKFGQMHDLVYSDAAGVAPEALEKYAVRLNLNSAALHQSLQTTAKARVRADLSDALTMKLPGTPTLILCVPGGRVRLVHFQDLEQSLPR